MSVLVGKSLPFQIIDLHIDQSGRYIILHASLRGNEYIFVGVYVPPPFQRALLDEIMAKVSLYPNLPFIILGDFNSTLSHSLDRLCPQQTHNKSLNNWASANNLTELWRWLHPRDRQFSCFSSTTNSLSRIDLAFANKDSLAQISAVEYLPRGISDHAPLLVVMTQRIAGPTKLWRLNPCWPDVVPVETKCTPAIAEYWQLNSGSSDPLTEWEAFKAVMRGVLIHAIASYRAKLRGRRLTLEREVATAEAAYIKQPGSDTCTHFREAQRNYDLHLTDYTQKRLLSQRQSICAEGDKNGRALAFLAKTEMPQTVVTNIQSANGDLLSDPQDVCARFREYYTHLYESKTDRSIEDITNFLGGLSLPSLSRDTGVELDRPITEEEVQRTINSMATRKSPGPDGFPVEWYKRNIDFHSARLVTLFQQSFNMASLPASFYEAVIVVIHKSGKPQDCCGSYRPISLININAKILTKILAMRLGTVILSLVSPDQSGFMPGKTTDINLRRLYTNLQIQHDNKGHRVIAALDNEKAFDSVEWNFMFAVLTRLGLPPGFLKWLRLIYLKPTAWVRVNGYISDPFPLGRGTRQGCPLSPFLFALVMEPLTALINGNTAIEGWSIAGITEKLSLYADDMLIYLADPKSSLEILLDTVDDFGSYSGLRVNWTKSILLPVDDFPFPDISVRSRLLVVDRFTYLGVVVHRDVRQFDILNITPTMQYVCCKLKAWEGLPLTLIGRINVFKMVLLPKLLYVYRAAPHSLPKLHFESIDKMLTPFLWKNQTPRLNRDTLKAPYEHGGLALPNMYIYYIAVQLSYASWWLRADANNPAVVLEAALVGSYEALANLVYREGRYPIKHYTSLMAATVSTWKRFVEVYRGGGEQYHLVALHYLVEKS